MTAHNMPPNGSRPHDTLHPHYTLRPSYTLRYMQPDDIPQVVEVDRLSFPSPWSPRSYGFEITDNPSSHMFVLEALSAPPRANNLRGLLRELWQRFNRPPHTTTIIGYAGLWLIAGEAHVSTIAVHPASRGNRLGELLLNALLWRALLLGGEYSVLEVRVSNLSAQALYQKYGYETVGRRKAYYRDNNEDAFLMHLAPLNDAYQARLQTWRSALAQTIAFVDQLVETDTHQAPST